MLSEIIVSLVSNTSGTAGLKEGKPEKGLPRPAKITFHESSLNGGRGRFDCRHKRPDCEHAVSACKQSRCDSRHGSGVSKHEHREGKHDDLACKQGRVVYSHTRSVCEHGRCAWKHAFSECKQNDRACKHRLCAYKHRTWIVSFGTESVLLQDKPAALTTDGRPVAESGRDALVA